MNERAKIAYDETRKAISAGREKQLQKISGLNRRMLYAMRIIVDAYGLPNNKGNEAPIIKNARALIAEAEGMK